MDNGEDSGFLATASSRQHESTVEQFPFITAPQGYNQYIEYISFSKY